MAWPSGNTGVGHINEATLRPTQLVLRRVTICGYAILVSNQPPRPTQLPTHSK